MIQVPGYTIAERFYSARSTVLYRGISDSDGQRVLIKLIDEEFPPLALIEGIKREYRFADRPYGERVLRALELVSVRNGPGFVMEDADCVPLADLIADGAMSPRDRLYVAREACEALVSVHAQGVLHNAVSPTTILCSRDFTRVKIYDFSLASLQSTGKNRGKVAYEGSYVYASPELTGRIEREIDCRSDLYSLGVTLYELFTGEPPFEGTDHELAYGHVARAPEEPRRKTPSLPRAVSDCIMKLLEKDCDRRYQTAAGLAYDLALCLDAENSPDKLVSFVPGERDNLETFHLPRRLYGRERELGAIKTALSSSGGSGASFLLVSGYSGIGKTSIVEEAVHRIVMEGARFVSGKFNPLEQGIPYSAVVVAMRTLSRLAITEADDPEAARRRVLDALGSNARVIGDVIPEFGALIGAAPAPGALDPVGEKNRFHRSFILFLRALATRSSPVILHLDDLQWADRPSLDLLESFVLSRELENVSLVGSYRDNEVREGHPLRAMLDRVEASAQARSRTRRFVLKELDEGGITQLVADATRRKTSEVRELAEFLYAKTRGNPFYATRLLQSLYDKGCFFLDRDRMSWYWSIDTVKSLAYGDNVVDFLVEGFSSLSPNALLTLKLASCVGSRFELSVLYALAPPDADVPAALWTLMEKWLVMPVGNGFRLMDMDKSSLLDSAVSVEFAFQHDRIRQAAYGLVGDDERESLHLKVGMALLSSGVPGTLPADRLFEVTNHLNMARSLVARGPGKDELVDLNVAAGAKSRANAAYESAREYFATAYSLLTEEELAADGARRYALASQYGETLFLCGRGEEALLVLESLLSWERDRMRLARVYALRAMILDHGESSRERALAEIRTALDLFGVVLPATAVEAESAIRAGIASLPKTTGALLEAGVDSLARMRDDDDVMTMNLLFQALPITYQGYPWIYSAITFKMLEMTVTRGVTDVSCKNLVECGMILGSELGDYRAGYELAAFAFRLIERHRFEGQRAPCYFIFANFISAWNRPIRESVEYFDLAVSNGISCGDIQHAAYACAHRFNRLLLSGVSLATCADELKTLVAFLRSNGATMLLIYADLFQYVLDRLVKGATYESGSRVREAIVGGDNSFYKLTLAQNETMVACLLGEYGRARQWISYGEPFVAAGTALFPQADHALFEAVVIRREIAYLDANERESAFARLEEIAGRLAVWAGNAPSNFAHKSLAAAAIVGMARGAPMEEIARDVQGALDALCSGDFGQIKSVICGLAGEYWLSRGNELIASAYIREAWYAARVWGASAMVSRLEASYPVFLSEVRTSFERTRDPAGEDADRKQGAGVVDARELLEAARNISSEQRLERLLPVALDAMVKCVFAERGSILVPRGETGALSVRAERASQSEGSRYADSLPIDRCSCACADIAYFAHRTGESVLLENASAHPDYRNNAYVSRTGTRSVLCAPVRIRDSERWVVYLENNLFDGAFTADSLRAVGEIAAQLAVSAENATLFGSLEKSLAERTKQLELLTSELKELSLRDPLTRLHNRRYVYEFVADLVRQFVKAKNVALVSASSRDERVKDRVFGAFLVDLDNFKRVNELYGHAVGDRAIVRFSERITSLVRENDFVARWGGEEFLVILNGATRDFFYEFPDRVLSAFRGEAVEIVDGVSVQQHVSIGCVPLPLDERFPDLIGLDQAIIVCDYALSLAKENGMNRAAVVSIAEAPELRLEEAKTCMRRFLADRRVECEYLRVAYVK